MRRLWTILARYDTEPAELFIALVTLLRGAWFLAFPYSGTEGLVSENPWFSAVFTALGASWLLVLARGNGVRARAWLAFISTALRIYSAVLITIVSPVAVNVPFQFATAVISVWLYLRLVRHKR